MLAQRVTMTEFLARIALLERCGERLHRVHVAWARTCIEDTYRARSGTRLACHQCQTFAKVVLIEAGLLPGERKPHDDG